MLRDGRGRFPVAQLRPWEAQHEPILRTRHQVLRPRHPTAADSCLSRAGPSRLFISARVNHCFSGVGRGPAACSEGSTRLCSRLHLLWHPRWTRKASRLADRTVLVSDPSEPSPLIKTSVTRVNPVLERLSPLNESRPIVSDEAISGFLPPRIIAFLFLRHF